MKKKILSIILLFLFSLLLLDGGLCLDNQDIIRLKKAGISDQTLQAMVQERTIETCAFSVQEILQLKNSGLSDETIRILIKEGSFIKHRKPVVYGKDIRSIRFTTAKDIIELKDAGVSDEVIQAIVVFGSRGVNDMQREKAWEMLKDMGIIVDMRNGHD